MIFVDYDDLLTPNAVERIMPSVGVQGVLALWFTGAMVEFPLSRETLCLKRTQ